MLPSDTRSYFADTGAFSTCASSSGSKRVVVAPVLGYLDRVGKPGPEAAQEELVDSWYARVLSACRRVDATPGLWPDNCDGAHRSSLAAGTTYSQQRTGTFEAYCDFSRQYDPKPESVTRFHFCCTRVHYRDGSATNGHGVAIPVYTGPGIDTFIKAVRTWRNFQLPSLTRDAHSSGART